MIFGKIESMRLDKYLKVSRIIKRRTVAKDACDKGIVTINGKVATIFQKCLYNSWLAA